ncbi:MAG: F0F1 ATP synthase subunit B [Actinobacteria bacterium]|nr:MAG: F0F1 ATP synthase subunit B [Actinomycetota bacterium]
MNTSVMAAGNFLIPNGTFIAELIAFLIVLFVLWRYVVPPVSKAMSDRQAMIKAQLDEGREASERLKQAEADYRSAMEEARTTAATIRDQARADAAAIREEMLEQAVQERDRVLESGREQLQHERDALVRQLRAELGELAVELASRILGESLAEEARQRGTVDRFLAEVQAAESGTAGAGGRR